MKLPDSQNHVHQEARQQLNGLRVVAPRSSRSEPFVYGYLSRLLDDTELNAIQDPRVRAQTRAAHREAYRTSLRLLRRDIRRILERRRKLMDATEQWSFESLLSDTARMWKLLAILHMAGVAHGLRLPALVSAAREACLELQGFLAQPVTAAPAFHGA